MKEKEEIELQNKIAKIATGDVVIRLNDNNKSILGIGNIKVYNTKNFNWFNRLIFRLFFGIKIEKVEELGWLND